MTTTEIGIDPFTTDAIDDTTLTLTIMACIADEIGDCTVTAGSDPFAFEVCRIQCKPLFKFHKL